MGEVVMGRKGRKELDGFLCFTRETGITFNDMLHTFLTPYVVSLFSSYIRNRSTQTAEAADRTHTNCKRAYFMRQQQG
jgi:hypothetical protein